MQHPTGRSPKRVALVAAGPSKREWLDLMCAATLDGEPIDEVWGINTVCRALVVDMTIAMDDPLKFKGHNPSRYAIYQHADHPVLTTVHRPECPPTVAFPLSEVLALPNVRGDYLNHSVAYAIAYAILIGVKELLVFGADYIAMTNPYATGSHTQTGAARYLACTAYWLGQAEARGMDVVICPASPLLDADVHPSQQFYGYLTKPVIRRTLKAPEPQPTETAEIVPLKAAGND